MQNVIVLWNGMSGQRRVVVVLATVIATLAVVGLARIAMSPSMSLLYSGLDAAAAGEVVQVLEQNGVAYEVRGGAIYVPATERDSLRMTLAAEGKPANGPTGYELLDSLSGFGTTSQMFDAAYWRAKEGELARTIMSNPQFRSARVHISNSNSRPFARGSQQSASVSVIPIGTSLPHAQAQALRYLVASAVAGLEPDAVAVIDGRVGRVVGNDDPGQADAGDLRAAELRRRAERLLEARVGLGNAVVEVSVENVTDREQIVERRLDPESRVMISTDTEERATTSTDTRDGAVTVASNLPEGDGSAAGASSSSDNTETRERVNYEVSETTREILRVPGGIQRISVAVLINEIADASPGAAEGTRSPDELEALRDLVASAVGIDESRGDTITVRSMPFSLVEPEGSEAATISPMSALFTDPMTLIQVSTFAVVALVLGLFVVRPILMRPAPPLQEIPRLSSAAGQPAPTSAPALSPPSREPGIGQSNASRRLAETLGNRDADVATALIGWMDPGERSS